MNPRTVSGWTFVLCAVLCTILPLGWSHDTLLLIINGIGWFSGALNMVVELLND